MVKVVEQSFKILTPIDADSVLRHIEMCGRTCYQSFDKISEDSHLKFAKHIIDRHHESVIEHFSVSVRFIVDRAIANELERHRLSSFSQESTRYCCYSKDKFGQEITVIPPIEILPDTPAFSIWLEACQQIEKKYFELIQNGQKAENARAVLPCCLKTEMVMTANLREWRHVFKMRCSDAAHPDVRFLMRDLRDTFKEKIPLIFDDLVD